jgi:hypothetical protein
MANSLKDRSISWISEAPNKDVLTRDKEIVAFIFQVFFKHGCLANLPRPKDQNHFAKRDFAF